ncbi:g9018 [Coccomyxa elongata]
MAWEASNAGPPSAQEPLLHSSPKEERPVLGLPVSPSERETVWRGTTWQGCPLLLACCSPLCCSVWQWDITEQRIDLTHGCCGSNMETIDLRRVVEIHFHRSLLQLCLNRGTITIHSDHAEYPDLNLTTFGTRKIFEGLREAWTRARIATAIDHQHDGHHEA